ncbi:MAG: hypothetical protein HGA45_41600, partial [Chloroflexales bacterium]|nr:hypothetical protein [Chloroflexales bacterium]
MFKYFPDPTTTSEDEAKALRKQLARQYHPDQGGDAAKMSEINTEFSRWLDFKRNPPIFVPAPTKWADPNSWWSAITGAVKQVKVEPVPPPPPSPAPASVAPSPAPRPAPQ